MYTAPAGRPDPRRREPLWDRVDRNRIKLAAYVAVFVVVTVVTTEIMLVSFGGCMLLYVAARMRMWWVFESLFASPTNLLAVIASLIGMISLGWALVAISRSEEWLVRRLGAVFVPQGELLPTKLALKDMAVAGGLPVAPMLYLLDDSSVNAFVFSARGRRPIVGVTEGLVARLSTDEQRAVFANLVARIVSGDTIVDTGVAAMMLPLNTYRTQRLERQNRAMDEAFLSGGTRVDTALTGGGNGALGLLFLFGVAMAIVASIFFAFQRRRHLRAGEKADAEGMLLLKDPRPMLSALEKCVVLDNMIPGAGESFADLFYCWPDSATNDETDPEWQRVARLREVLGVEGVVDERIAELPESLLAPPAPRIS